MRFTGSYVNTGHVFDIDGVIAKSERAHAKAHVDAFHSHGITNFTIDTYFTHFNGISAKERLLSVLELLGHKLPVESRKQLLADCRGNYKKKVLNGDVKPFRDAVNYILTLAQLGFQTTYASSSSNALATLNMMRAPFPGANGYLSPHEAKNLSHMPTGMPIFDLFSKEGLANPKSMPGKPSPDIFYSAASDCLLIDPKDCIAYEDQPAGVTSARLAGSTVIGISENSIQQSRLRDAGAHLVLPRLSVHYLPLIMYTHNKK